MGMGIRMGIEMETEAEIETDMEIETDGTRKQQRNGRATGGKRTGHRIRYKPNEIE
jgi:hypothetical protein